jgi:hypothetical protein
MRKKSKTKIDKPLTWNPDSITPVITSTGLAIGSAYERPVRGPMTAEELWVQKLLIKPGTRIPNNQLADQLMRLAALIIIVGLLYALARYPR